MKMFSIATEKHKISTIIPVFSMGEPAKEALLEATPQKDEHERKTLSATKFKYDAYIEKTRVRKLEKENEELKDRLLDSNVASNFGNRAIEDGDPRNIDCQDV